MPLSLASPAIPPGGEIPSQYTCDGADISPPLRWSGAPDGTSGRCPPKGDGTHHYLFRLLAISQPTLDLKPTAADADVLRTAEPHAIQRAELVGTHHR